MIYYILLSLQKREDGIVNTTMIVIAIVLYLGFMVAIGFYYSNKNKNIGDFYLGGRKLGPLVTAMSAEASDMSAYLLMGIPGLALMCGLAEAAWTAIGLAVGTYINWLIVSKRLRKYSERIDATTIPEFFSKRFGDKHHILSLISAIIIIVFFIPYTASGFSACGKLFGSLFGMDYTLAMVISAAVIILYCTLGGFLAASTTDLIQSIIMTIALFVVVGFSEGLIGGFDNVFANVHSLNGFTNLFQGFDVASATTGSFDGFKIVSTLAWGLGYFGMPHILLRFMAIDNPNKLKTSRRIASVWVVISMGLAILVGVVGLSLMQQGIIGPYESSSAAETVIVDISSFLATRGYIPAFIGGVFISGILASTMSTADSQLIAASSSVTQDILVDTCKIKLSDKKQMVIARLSVIVISVIAIFLARDPNGSVFRIVSFAWAGFGAAFGPVMLFGLFWKRTTKGGAVAGMIVGGAMVFIWKYLIAPKGGVLAVYELLPAFLCGCIAIVVVSLITKKPGEEITSVFDEIKADIKNKRARKTEVATNAVTE
ncbi:MAG: sodium/proline symporter [Oscillospiraceae bacterium]|nr:sodium/proline symporter [Oscillospiraceae bacterium]